MSKLLSLGELAGDFYRAAILGAIAGGLTYAATHDEPKREDSAHKEYLQEMYKWDACGAGGAGLLLAAAKLRRRRKDTSPDLNNH